MVDFINMIHFVCLNIDDLLPQTCVCHMNSAPEYSS